MMHLTFINLLHEKLKNNNFDPTEWEIRSLQQVESTNDTVNKLLFYYKKTVVLATTQLKGRGRNNTVWDSAEGGCWLSIGLIKKIPVIELATPVTKIVKNVLSKYVDCLIKYPNDIIVNNKKLAGILVETEICGQDIEKIILGIGINVKNEIPRNLQDIATRLSDYYTAPDVSTVASEVSLALIKFLNELDKTNKV